MIEIANGDHVWNGDRDRDRDLNFGDRAHALEKSEKSLNEFNSFNNTFLGIKISSHDLAPFKDIDEWLITQLSGFFLIVLIQSSSSIRGA